MDDQLKTAMWNHCEKIGESQVRTNIATHVYGDKKLVHIREWLRLKEQTGEAGRHQQNVQLAEDANAIARDANHLSKWAVGISIISLAVAGLALYLD